MPQVLCRAFQADREWTVKVNEYPVGDSQRRAITTTSRKRWRLSVRLTSSLLSTLRAFFETCLGGIISFYFYDGTETASPWDWDATGTVTTGRYTVRFEGGWSQIHNLGRHDVELTLVEIT